MDQPLFRYPETASLLRALHAQRRHVADVAPHIDPSYWHDNYLHRLPEEVAARIYVDADGGISRKMLYGLAEQSRTEPDDDRRLSDLFWNILAWGISGDWRRVGAITGDLAARPEPVLDGLRRARDASFDGQLADAYTAVDHLLSYWGPAFMTKFLAFTSSPIDDGKIKAITVDSRVQLAWQILIGPEGAQALTPKRYEQLCEQTGLIARANRWTSDEFEQRLFIFGQEVGSYANWADAELRSIRGSTPTKPASEVAAQLRNGTE